MAASTVPVAEYAPSIVGEFPRITRQRLVESSIASKSTVDILPVNLGSNARLQDKYLEFRVPGVKGSFIDLGRFVLELKLSLTQADGVTKVEDGINVSFANGTANTIFKSIQVYIGNQLIESNPLYNYWSFIKMLTTISPAKLDSLGEVGNIFTYDKRGSGTRIVDKFDAEYFTNLGNEVKRKLKGYKENGLHLAFPIMSDIASCDQYLLDDIPLRIRLELANESWYLNTDGNGSEIRSHIDFAKLWVSRITPYPAALQSLNSQLQAGAETRTLFNKTLFKSLVLGKQQTSLVSDLPWGSIVPERIYVAMIGMTAFSGAYKENGLHFSNSNLSELTVSINGVSVYKTNVDFPHECSQAYFTTIESLGIENDHLLDFDTFKRGRTLFIYNLLPEDVQGTVPVEQSGNLRISFQLKEGVDENVVILLFADTKAVMSVNYDRNVTCDSRA